MPHRRLARDYEALPARSEAMVYLAMIDVMAGRITGESTPTWRGAQPDQAEPAGSNAVLLTRRPL